ncbi:uncharacterized protein LOC124914373 [Impatiens glandulifera]|uniref:uncharacterized protein LOC124914373 n=1 Tax=Impatiens glandulifera TaxID=253017 RepID=UPI001FB17B27|nr:uncharacterized protein LOC124914373 [Impatiens glandulifera]
MAIQIGEMSKVQVSKTQTQIESDAKTAKRLQEEEMERIRLQKEIEDKDYEFAQKCNEEEQANIQKLPPVQPSHSMNTRNKKKRSAVVNVIKRAEQRAVVPIALNVQPLDEEEEEDAEELSQRKRRATEGSTATPSFRPTIAPLRPPLKPVCANFGFSKKTPSHSSVWTGMLIDAARRDREWKAREEEERRQREPLPPNNILNSESMSEKTDKAVKPKSSRTKSSKGTSSSAPAEEYSKKEKPKKKAVEAEASQEKNGRKKSSAKKISSKPADSEKTLSSDKSPKRTGDVFQPILINTVRPISVDSQSPRQTEPSGSHKTESASKEEADVNINSENSKSPSKKIDEEPSGSAGNKSAPKDTTTQSAQDGPAASTIPPEGLVQVNKGKGVLQTGSQPEITTEGKVTFSAEEEEDMFDRLVWDMNRDASDLISPYLLWVQLRCETKLSDMIPGMSGNKEWEKLVKLEETALKMANTNLVQPAFSKTEVILEYARLQAVEDALKEAQGAALTPIEVRMTERFHPVREKILKNLDWLDAQWRSNCRHQLINADLYQRKHFFVGGETSRTVEHWGQDPPQNDKAPELEQVKLAVIETLESCLGNYSTATDEKIAKAETNLSNTIRGTVQSEMTNTVQTSIRSMIDEAVQTSVKSLITESIQTATAPLVDMLQAMTVQIGELSKLHVSKTQEHINSDAETAKKLQDEERERERSRKELEEKDHELAQKCNEEEHATIHEPIPAQPSHAMKTRNKGKRKAVAKVLKRAEQNSQRVTEPVGLNVQTLDEEEEEDIEELNRRKKREMESSTATPSSRPIVAQTSRPPKLVCTGFRFGKRTPGISSVWVGLQIDAARRAREWKEREEEELRRLEKELKKGGPSKP